MDHPFFFGAATSSHQVEGGNRNNWTEWEKKNAKRLASEAAKKQWPDFTLKNFPGPLQEENYISGRACDHYYRFEKDFDIAKSLGHNAHRFSIEWSRIEPEEGKFDEKEVEHYRKVLKALRERGLEPFVTIWHWTLPCWLVEKGGILAERFPEYFVRYAEKLANEFKGDVRFWMTINEPEVVSRQSYWTGNWPPQERSIFLFYKSMSRLITAHRLSHERIKEISSEAQVGVVLDIAWFESAGGIINDVLKKVIDRAGNFYFLNRVRNSLDFIGLNYYFRNRINYGFNKNPNESVNDLGWDICPEGIYHVLKDLKKYHLPIYITENGLADARDAKRKYFIVNHLTWVRNAMEEGVDVRGYFHWSLLDNFEWAYGFWPRFGLVEVDYKTMKRKIRPSAYIYEKIIKSW